MQCIHQCIKYCNCLSQQSVSYSFLGPANREVFTSSSFSISSSVSVWSLHSAIGDELWIPWRIADRVLSRKLLALQRPLARLQRCIVIFSLEFWTHASSGAVHSALAKTDLQQLDAVTGRIHCHARQHHDVIGCSETRMAIAQSVCAL